MQYPKEVPQKRDFFYAIPYLENMPKETHTYSNREITVIWKPALCRHSTLCWKGLLPVFDPRNKPWIDMEGASSDRIIEQVKKCPSGALSFRINESAGKEGTVE